MKRSDKRPIDQWKPDGKRKTVSHSEPSRNYKCIHQL